MDFKKFERIKLMILVLTCELISITVAVYDRCNVRTKLIKLECLDWDWKSFFTWYFNYKNRPKILQKNKYWLLTSNHSNFHQKKSCSLNTEFHCNLFRQGNYFIMCVYVCNLIPSISNFKIADFWISIQRYFFNFLSCCCLLLLLLLLLFLSLKTSSSKIQFQIIIENLLYFCPNHKIRMNERKKRNV